MTDDTQTRLTQLLRANMNRFALAPHFRERLAQVHQHVSMAAEEKMTPERREALLRHVLGLAEGMARELDQR